jgi:DNA processing protein
VTALAPLLEPGATPSGRAEDGERTTASEPLWDELDLFGEEPPTAMLVDEEPEPADDPARRVIGLLGPMPVALDDLIRAAALPPGTVRSILLELEMAGRIERHGNSLVSLL